MKKFLTYSIIAILAAGGLSCSSDKYEYIPGDGSYYQGHNKPPQKTMPGKVIFDYSIGTFHNYYSLMNDVLLFDKYYTASEEEREIIKQMYYYNLEITSEGNSWKIRDYNRSTWIFELEDGKSLTQAGAVWKISCNTPYISIPKDRCTVSYVDSKSVDLKISGTNVSGTKEFSGITDLEVGYEFNELESEYLYDISFKGEGTLTAIGESFFTIDYSITEGLDSFVSLSNYYYHSRDLGFRGKFDMTAKNSQKKTEDKASVEMIDFSEIYITYGGLTEKWKYNRYRNYYDY